MYTFGFELDCAGRYKPSQKDASVLVKLLYGQEYRRWNLEQMYNLRKLYTVYNVSNTFIWIQTSNHSVMFRPVTYGVEYWCTILSTVWFVWCHSFLIIQFRIFAHSIHKLIQFTIFFYCSPQAKLIFCSNSSKYEKSSMKVALARFLYREKCVPYFSYVEWWQWSGIDVNIYTLRTAQINLAWWGHSFEMKTMTRFFFVPNRMMLNVYIVIHCTHSVKSNRCTPPPPPPR